MFLSIRSGFIPVNGGDRIYPSLTAISPTPTFHLARFMASCFSKPTLLLSFSTSVFHVFFGRPRFLLPLSLQTLTLFSKRAHHPSSTYALNISLHSPLPSEPLFPLIPTSPLGPLFLHQFCTTHCSHHCSLGPSQNCHFILPQTPCLTHTISHS